MTTSSVCTTCKVDTFCCPCCGALFSIKLDVNDINHVLVSDVWSSMCLMDSVKVSALL